jgi:hypothetical protein
MLVLLYIEAIQWRKASSQFSWQSQLTKEDTFSRTAYYIAFDSPRPVFYYSISGHMQTALNKSSMPRPFKIINHIHLRYSSLYLWVYAKAHIPTEKISSPPRQIHFYWMQSHTPDEWQKQYTVIELELISSKKSNWTNFFKKKVLELIF